MRLYLSQVTTDFLIIMESAKTANRRSIIVYPHIFRFKPKTGKRLNIIIYRGTRNFEVRPSCNSRAGRVDTSILDGHS